MGCERIFIACDRPLPLIPFSQDAPDIWVGEPDGEDEEVRSLFSKPYVYSIGSHEGCGCGFAYDSYQTFDYSIWRAEQETVGLSEETIRNIWDVQMNRYSEDERRAFRESYVQSRRSVRHLSEYLHAATESGPVELYVRWGYDPVEEPKHRETVTPGHFGGASFRLTHEALFTVQKALA